MKLFFGIVVIDIFINVVEVFHIHLFSSDIFHLQLQDFIFVFRWGIKFLISLEIVENFVRNMLSFRFLIQLHADFLLWFDHNLIGQYTNELFVFRRTEFLIMYVFFVFLNILWNNLFLTIYLIVKRLWIAPETCFLYFCWMEPSFFCLDTNIFHF